MLAYRPLRLDVKKRALRAEPEPVICREFTVNGSKLSIHQFLDADDYTLLDEFTKHAETIKDRITRSNPRVRSMTCPTSSPSAATAPWTWSMSTAASLLCSRIPPARR